MSVAALDSKDKQQHDAGAATLSKVDWSKRYEREGHIWGDDPSPTALLLANILRPNSKVFEYGYGYGRDVVELMARGHHVQGIDEAAEGLKEATKMVAKMLNGRVATLSSGDFAQTILPRGQFDAVTSHRMLHLLGNNGKVRAFVESAAHVLKPGGLLYVSARNQNDFHDEKMVRISDDLVERKDRPGHLISLWDQARFEKVFGQNFEMIDFVDGQEIESMGSNEMTNFTIMAAKKKKGRSTGPT